MQLIQDSSTYHLTYTQDLVTEVVLPCPVHLVLTVHVTIMSRVYLIQNKTLLVSGPWSITVPVS